MKTYTDMITGTKYTEAEFFKMFDAWVADKESGRTKLDVDAYIRECMAIENHEGE